MNLRIVLTLIAIVAVSCFLCTLEPSFVALIVPLCYLLVTVAIILWILNRSRLVTAPPRFRPPPDELDPADGGRHLRAADIMSWEFEYARTTASEAMRDRQSVVNFYLAIAGAFPAAIALIIVEGPGLNELPAYHLVGTVVLWALVVVGWNFFLQVIHLRRAWHQSAQAMNCIKDFYLKHSTEFEHGQLAQAFLWKTRSLPRPEKKWNIFFFSAALIAFLNSLCFLFGSMLLDLQAYELSHGTVWTIFYWGALVAAGLAMFLFHMAMYQAFLKEPGRKISVMRENQKVSSKAERRVEVLEQRREYDGVYKLDRVRYRFEQFDGTLSDPVTRLVFERGDSVCVLPYDPLKDAVLLINQFRYPAYIRNGPGWLWEIVAGVQDRDRDRVAVAHAELMEESGYQVETLVPIMNFYLSPGGSSERIYLYLAYITAENHVAPGGGLASENEDIAVSLVPFQQAVKMVESGTIVDAKTVIALQWLALHRRNLPRLPLK